ncbi:MAG TPA: DNA internalization-related competence protein ComEC/Rec2 [Terracidiphilus sp.]|nr:DNA internalization-related competence protein ComEC/Rec2 [Terracidiphilus sp.]
MQLETNNEQTSAAYDAVPLFHAAWLFALGIVVASHLWLRPSLVLIAAALTAVLCVMANLRAPRIAWAPMATLWVLFGVWCALMQPQPVPAPELAALSDNLLRTVEGTVIDTGPVRSELEPNVDEPSTQSPAQRVDLRVSTVELVTDSEDRQIAVGGEVRLNVRWPAGAATPSIQPFRCGERIRADVRLLRPEIYRDPGVWSRADYLLDQGVTSTAPVSIDRVRRDGTAQLPPLTSVACMTVGWQHATTTRLLALPAAMRRLPAPLRLSEDDAVMLAAMVAGDRTYLTHNLRVGFERTGSFHMLVVSGIHLAIVAACIFFVARRLRLGRVSATVLTIAASLAYALFTGFATPVQRSLLMITLYLLGRLIYRERRPLNTIGFAALCLLAASPRSLFDSSLQMTLLAVVVIAGVAAPLLESTIHPYLEATRNLEITSLDMKLQPNVATMRHLLRSVRVFCPVAPSTITRKAIPWVVRFSIRVVELVIVSCIVELAMTLPMAVYFHRITVFALPVNIVILPLLAVLMPAALLMLLLLAVWPAAATVPAAVVALVLHLGVGLMRLFGGLRFGDVRVATPLAWQSAVFCFLLAAAIFFARRARWQRRLAWTAMLLAALAAVVPRPIDHPHNALLVEAVDVGQGDSILLVTPDGKTLLVDGGGFGGGPRQTAPDFDIGEEVVSPALWARGIRHLDAVALTHGHSDHMGGLPAVLRNFHPDEFWVGKNPRFAAYNALLDEATSLHTRINSFHSGEIFNFGSTRVEVLAPFPNYLPGPVPTNNDSLVLHVVYRETSVMLEGDAEAPIEKAMLVEPDLKSTLLKVGHHGSTTSTRPEFLARVAPEWAVISCGLHNRYGHPRQEVLEELQAAQVHTLRTDMNGISCFLLNGTSLTPDFNCSAK